MSSGKLIGVIGDEDTVAGFLLAGVGQRDVGGTNFMVVSSKTKIFEIEEAFKRIAARTDVAILMINQHVANQIRALVTDHVESGKTPTLLEIPSKEHPYDPAKDPVMQSVTHLLGLD